MSFDKDTRNALSKMVATCRRLLTEDVTDQLRGRFGMYPDGNCLSIDRLDHLAEDERSAAEALRELQDHFAAGEAGRPDQRKRGAYDRLVLEISFTALNRLAALRLCEERGLAVECVRKGTASDGFRLFERVSGGALGTRHQTYRVFLECLFDELALDLGVLFDRSTPQSAVFPGERCLADVLGQLNRPELSPLWAADETIGWIYQYFNPPEERKAMRDASQAPRNSRELAVRNQFFTPRYVVEFLTDNALGRIWYEMRKGDTALKEECRYLVRRPNEIFLAAAERMLAVDNSEADLSQEELLKKPVYIEHRPKKDPRDLRVLDPACGSGHFLLYAFDLLQRTYEEAWEDPESPKSGVTGQTLRGDFETLDDLRRGVPKLIIEHNLHGIDIDSRAVQIAALALWLRAQKSWKMLGLKPAERPKVERSNIVTAEPMPGEEDMRRDFTADLKPRVLGQLVDVVFEKMKLAGEAGSLLKIEEEIKDAVAAAKAEYVAEQRRRRDEAGYFPGMAPPHEATLFDFTDLSEDEFWETVEDLILAALRSYAEQAENGRAVRRRLFAQDAARGFAFIDLCRRRYDVVLMNPPFGSASLGSATYLKAKYSDTKDDVDAAFVDRAAVLLRSIGLLGGIYNRTQFFKGYLDAWRHRNLVAPRQIEVALDLGYGVLDAALVEAACYTTRRSGSRQVPAMFYRLLNATDKGVDLTSALMRPDGTSTRQRFVINPRVFPSLPGSRISYWATAELLKAFRRCKPVEGHWGEARQGLITSDNDRFLRLTWEVPRQGLARSESETFHGRRWVFYAKGGEYSPYYGGIHLAVNWEKAGLQIKNFLLPSGKLASRPQNLRYYFKPALTYTERTASAFSPRVLPEGTIFDCKGPIIAPTGDMAPLCVLGFCMSRVFSYFVELSVAAGDAASSGSAARQYTQSIVGSVPVPEVPAAVQAAVASAAGRVWASRGELERRDEGDAFFSLPFILAVRQSAGDGGLLGAVSQSDRETERIWTDIVCQTGAIEELVAQCYGLDPCSLEEISVETGEHPSRFSRRALTGTEGDLLTEYAGCSIESIIDREVERTGGYRSLTKKAYFADRRLEILSAAFGCHPESIVQEWQKIADRSWEPRGKHVEELLSYAVGSAFGRWDMRIALAPPLSPPLPEPFAVLPVCPPGMLVTPDGLPAESGRIVSEEWLHARPDASTLPPEGTVKNRTVPDSEYPLRVSWDGILVDEPGFNGGQPHQDDIIRRAREVFDLLWKNKAHEIEQEACDILGVTDLRDYFRTPTGFFQDHLKRYSKSRRKAPIYWPLSTASGSYTLWLYYHRLTNQTLYAAINKYVEPKITEVEHAVNHIEKELESASGRGAAVLRDRLNEGRAFLIELRDLRTELLRIAALPYKPNLNDGVIINAAPFHSLFRLRTWADDVEEVWRNLDTGAYDWAHLAYTLWPDRVRETCRKDRSIAIAHGLESLCEVALPTAKEGGTKGRKKNEVDR